MMQISSFCYAALHLCVALQEKVVRKNLSLCLLVAVHTWKTAAACLQQMVLLHFSEIAASSQASTETVTGNLQSSEAS